MNTWKEYTLINSSIYFIFTINNISSLQYASVKKFIEESNDRIKQNEAEIKRLEGLLKYSQMTMEDFKDAHPDLALDPLNKPTIWPHTPEYQPDPEDDKKSSH